MEQYPPIGFAYNNLPLNKRIFSQFLHLVGVWFLQKSQIKDVDQVFHHFALYFAAGFFLINIDFFLWSDFYWKIYLFLILNSVCNFESFFFIFMPVCNKQIRIAYHPLLLERGKTCSIKKTKKNRMFGSDEIFCFQW